MRIISPAKINLLLWISGKRDDGYHELITLMMPVSLSDTIDVDQTSSGIDLLAPGCGCEAVDNIAYKAAKAFFQITKIKSGVRIKIEKNIPYGAGLGGGSSNAAHTLIGLNETFRTGLTETELMDIVSTIGADCPFFIHGKPSLMGERGDKLISDVEIEDRIYLLVVPPFGISTAKVYSNLKIPLTQRNFPFNINEIKKEIIAPERLLVNELECSAFGLHPELKTVKEDLLRAGAIGALMSGSGSAVFGVFEDAGHLEHAMSKLGKFEGYRYIPTTRTLGGINGDYRS